MTFKFPATLENLEGVPELFQSLYTQTDEGYELNSDLRAVISDGGRLSETVEKERKKALNFERELKAWRKIAESPEKVQEIIETAKSEGSAKITELQKLLDEGGNASSKFEKLKADMEVAHKKALADKDADIQRIEGSLRKHLIESAAVAAISDAKGRVKPLLPTIVSKLQLFQENGEYVVRVVDTDGDPRGDGKGGYLDIKGLVAELREDADYAPLFEASGVSGSGAAGRGAPSGGLPPGLKNPWAAGTFNMTEQMKIAKENPQLAAKLQAAARQ
jgi:hypothetical protein